MESSQFPSSSADSSSTRSISSGVIADPLLELSLKISRLEDFVSQLSKEFSQFKEETKKNQDARSHQISYVQDLTNLNLNSLSNQISGLMAANLGANSLFQESLTELTDQMKSLTHSVKRLNPSPSSPPAQARAIDKSGS